MNGEWFGIFWISIKAIHHKALGFYIFHYFNISKHISVSVLFVQFLYHVLSFLARFLKIIAPGWAFSTIFLPQGSGFHTFFVPEGWGIRPFKKIPRGFARGMVRLGIDWYINGVLSCRAKLFKCLRHNLLNLRQVSSMWRYKPDLLIFRFITGTGDLLSKHALGIL